MQYNIGCFYRSNLPELFCLKCVLKNFTKFTRKDLCQGIFFNKVTSLYLSNASGGCFHLFLRTVENGHENILTFLFFYFFCSYCSYNFEYPSVIDLKHHALYFSKMFDLVISKRASNSRQ